MPKLNDVTRFQSEIRKLEAIPGTIRKIADDFDRQIADLKKSAAGLRVVDQLSVTALFELAEAPASGPGSDQPPADQPPADQPPAGTEGTRKRRGRKSASSDTPPTDEPPTDEPPTEEPPTEEPPTE